MSRLKKNLLIILTVSLLTGCNFINNTRKYKDTTKEFVETLIKEDYNKCVELMAMEHETARNTDIDALKMRLTNIREILIDNWGTQLDYSLLETKKKFTFIGKKHDDTPPNTTLVFIEFNNKKELGIFKVLFDDNSKKILNFEITDVKKTVPSMTYFWLFGLFAICIALFNIYVIIQIKQSKLKRKWLKYIAVLLLNVPTISYAAVKGLSFKLLHFQFLLGIGFHCTGYLNSVWAFGIPLGGIYWFWRLKRKKNAAIEPDILADSNDNNIEEQ